MKITHLQRPNLCSLCVLRCSPLGGPVAEDPVDGGDAGGRVVGTHTCSKTTVQRQLFKDNCCWYANLRGFLMNVRHKNNDSNDDNNDNNDKYVRKSC